MANLEDVVAGLELNAELSQEIRDFSKDQLRVSLDIESNLDQFVKELKKLQLDLLEASRESGRSNGQPRTFGQAFRESAGQSSGEGVGKGIGLAATGLGAGVGLTALGLGIGGFFAGLAAGDKALTWINTDMTRLKGTMITLGEAFAETPTEGLLKMGAAAAIGAKFGSLKGALNMTFFGAGLGGFFAGLALGDKGAQLLGTDGQSLANIMKGMGEGLNAFDNTSLLALGALVAVGSTVGAAALTNLPLFGVALGGFFAGLAGVTDLAGALGADGSGLKAILLNTSDGLMKLTELDVDKLVGLGPGLASVGAGLIALMGAKGLASITDTIGNFFSDDGAPSIFERIGQDLQTLSDIDISKMTGFDALADSMFKLGDGMDKVAETDMDDFRDNIEELGKAIAFAIPIFDKMWNGDKLGAGWFDGYGEVDFGEGLKSVPVQKIGDAMSSIASFPIADAVSEGTMSAVAQTQSGGVTVINNNTNAPTTTQNNISSGGGDIPMPSATNSGSTRVDAYA